MLSPLPHCYIGNCGPEAGAGTRCDPACMGLRPGANPVCVGLGSGPGPELESGLTPACMWAGP